MRAAACLLALLLAAPVVSADQAAPDVEALVRRALEARLGPAAEVALGELRLVARPRGPVVDAQVATGARFERPVLVRLATRDERGNLAWTGAVSVRVHATVTHAHAAHAIARGGQLAAEDLEVARHELTRGPLTAWPQAEDLVRGRVLRDLPAGACIARTAVSSAPAVQTGQEVTALVRVGGVEASAQMVAADSGEPGAIIRVVNQQSRRVLKARIVAAGTVEIVP